MVVARDGTAYVGNFGSDLLAGEPLRGADLSMVRPDGTASVVASGLLFPNGSVITPDGRSLIVGETLGHQFTAFDIRSDGSLGPGRVWAKLDGMAPDGCALDAEGCIWFADAGAARVVRVCEGGEVKQSITTPGNVYACALGGPSGRELFVLTADTVPIPEEHAELGTGQIWTVPVEVPHAGLP